MRKMMLINPHPPGRHGEESISVIVQMPLNLAYIAALTPGDWEFDIIDENLELALDDNGDITFEPVDMVCITSVTYQVPRAYQIAEACRKKGMTVIMGGIHASVVPEEASKHVDAIFIGEAEKLWPQVIKDFEKNELKKKYEGGLPGLSEMKHVFPDRELLKKKYDYKFSSIVTTKGCPNYCDFCSVPTFQGKKYRERPYEDVLDEMEATDYKGLMFAEDNFYGHSKNSANRAKDLFRAMIDRGIKKDWLGFTALNISKDAEVLDLMAKSGNFGFLCGIESTNEAVLEKMNKTTNLRIGADKYYDSVQKIHDHGLVVWGSIVLGADGDDKDSFKRMTEFVLQNNIDVLTFGINCPFPKTALYDRLDSEKRIFRKNYPEDWKYYDTAHVVHRLIDMNLEEFIEGMQYMYDNLYAGDNLRLRFRKSLQTIGSTTHGKRNAMFGFRVGSDWTQVFEQVLENLRKLYDSGAYYKDWYKSSTVTVPTEKGIAV